MRLQNLNDDIKDFYLIIMIDTNIVLFSNIAETFSEELISK